MAGKKDLFAYEVVLLPDDCPFCKTFDSKHDEIRKWDREDLRMLNVRPFRHYGERINEKKCKNCLEQV